MKLLNDDPSPNRTWSDYPRDLSAWFGSGFDRDDSVTFVQFAPEKVRNAPIGNIIILDRPRYCLMDKRVASHDSPASVRSV